MTLLAAGRSALLATWPAISLFVARRTTLFNARGVRARVADFIALLALPRITSLVASLLAMLTARRGRRRIGALALRPTPLPALRPIALLLTGRVMKCSTELAKLLAQRSATLLVTSPTAPLRTRRVIRFIAGFTAPFVTRASVLFATFSTCTAPFGRHLSRRRARPPTRVTRLIGFRILRWAAHRVAGVGRLAGRRRFLVRPSGTFGYIRHGGAL
ncbi:hypothetical protein [Paraburkholderia sp. Cpub6]|uniref:hypothetical protein n=1 Tax=Paraburkholderia sp. Cpub6 TaxID=2723094 RepID=UPI0021A4D7B7|nr:hypothetical protein [Paraburkholderia sp. Cpub6]